MVLKLPKEANAKRVKVKAKNKKEQCDLGKEKETTNVQQGPIFSRGGQVFIKYYFFVEAKSS